MVTKDELIFMARQAAIRHNIPPEVVCGMCQRETEWNPWAMRYEPAFFSKYVAPLYTSGKITATEAYARGMSWGLLQIMGQTSREKGFTGLFLSELCDPATGLEYGCADFAHLLRLSVENVASALEKYNGGNNPNYAKEVLAFAETYTSSLPPIT